MERILKLKQIFDLTLGVILIGTLVFFFAFGSCLWIARQEAMRSTDQMMARNIAYVQEYINGELVRVEDACYTLASNTFGDVVRNDDGTSHVAINPKTFVQPTEEECYEMMESFLGANPLITGVTVAFEPYVYPALNAQYGFAPFVVRVGDKLQRFQIGEFADYRNQDWYRIPTTTGHQYWTDPFEEQTQQQWVAAFTIPLYGWGNRLVGTMALAMNVGEFADRLRQASPYEGAELKLISDSADYYASLPFHYVFTNPHSDGTYMLVCPEEEVMGGLRHMQRDMAIVGAIGLLLMIICFLILFRRMQKVNMAKAGIESELRVASAIQMSMIPKFNPAFPGRDELDVYGFILPAKSVGGDLYDYLIRDDKFYFCVGDVSGKGVPASLFMAVVRALFRNIVTQTDNPAELVGRLNDIVVEGNEMNMFCTFFVGILDLKTGHLAYCNAGHNAPIIRRRKEDSAVDVHYLHPHTNLALGVFGGFPFEAEELTFAPGEAIFLYTDGVTEAENTKHELFGEQATLDALHSVRVRHDLTPKAFVEGVYEKIKQHAGNAEQSDDITMLVVEYRGEKQ